MRDDNNILDKKGKKEYTYNEKNQLVSWKSAGGYTTYQYDQQGNLLQATGTEGNTFYSYNAFNQQTAVVMANGDRLESRYDPEKLRAQTKENGKTINFLYHHGELIAELNDQGEPQGRYILGYGVAAGWRKGKEGYNPYHLDEQNSTMYITGEKGAIQNRYHYDAFGVVEERQQGIENRILYTGQQYDQMTGQYYLRARYYNPVLGRFLQEDVYENQGKRSGAYSCGHRVHPFVLLNHKETLDSEFTLAHEMGHALHSYLSHRTQTPVDAGYVIFVAEVASTCNEALLMQSLLKKTEDKKVRAYLINYFLEQFRTTVYRQTMFAEFEMLINKASEEGQALTSEMLNKLYHELNVKYYGPDVVVDEEIDFEYSSYAGTRKFTAPFEGVLPTLDRRHSETKSQGMRDFYEMYMTN